MVTTAVTEQISLSFHDIVIIGIVNRHRMHVYHVRVLLG